MPGSEDGSRWLRYSGLGLELAGATVLLALLGWWIDGRYGTAPWGVLIGALVGIAIGMTHLIRSALRAMKASQREAEEHGRTDQR